MWHVETLFYQSDAKVPAKRKCKTHFHKYIHHFSTKPNEFTILLKHLKETILLNEYTCEGLNEILISHFFNASPLSGTLQLHV